jgi:hypothetical protein
MIKQSIKYWHWTAFILAVALAMVLGGVRPGLANGKTAGIVNGITTQGDAYMTGGVGIEERDQMKKQANSYDLELSFADHAGDYLSDVRIVIDDEHSKEVVNTQSGPWFYIELPAGKYDVTATFANRTEQIKDIQISKGHLETRLLHWNLADHQISERRGIPSVISKLG